MSKNLLYHPRSSHTPIGFNLNWDSMVGLCLSSSSNNRSDCRPLCHQIPCWSLISHRNHTAGVPLHHRDLARALDPLPPSPFARESCGYPSSSFRPLVPPHHWTGPSMLDCMPSEPRRSHPHAAGTLPEPLSLPPLWAKDPLTWVGWSFIYHYDVLHHAAPSLLLTGLSSSYQDRCHCSLLSLDHSSSSIA